MNAGGQVYKLLEEMTAQVSSLTHQVAITNSAKTWNSYAGEPSAAVASYWNTEQFMEKMEEVQYIDNNSVYSNCWGGDQLNQHYPEWKNEESPAYDNLWHPMYPQAEFPPHPPGFQSQQLEEKPSLEELVMTFVNESRARSNKMEPRMDNVGAQMGNMSTTMQCLGAPIGQLSNSVNSTSNEVSLSYTEKDPMEHCSAGIWQGGKILESPEQKDEEALTPSTETPDQCIQGGEEEAKSWQTPTYEAQWSISEEIKIQRKEKKRFKVTVGNEYRADHVEDPIVDIEEMHFVEQRGVVEKADRPMPRIREPDHRKAKIQRKRKKQEDAKTESG